LDCVGVVVCAAREAGLDVADVLGYSQTAGRDMQLIEKLKQHAEEVKEQPAQGDVVVFRWPDSPLPHHVAIYAGDGFIIHSYATARRCVMHRLDNAWLSRVTNIFRLKNNHG
jgi:cell wall-associated NlpC family hydrolase